MSIDLTVNNALRDMIASNLAAFQTRRLNTAGRKHAAVAVTIVNCEIDANYPDIPFRKSDTHKAAFILTTRASRLKSHAGQRAFPGGRIDAEETSQQAALREMSEEVGLTLGPEDVLGRLDDYATRSGFIMSPFVVWGGVGAKLFANPNEVESIHRIPVSELLRDDAPILESIPESDHPVLKMPLGSYDWFAAPTAAIAYQFAEVAIRGKQTRVAHFEQPHFAWR